MNWMTWALERRLTTLDGLVILVSGILIMVLIRLLERYQ